MIENVQILESIPVSPKTAYSSARYHLDLTALFTSTRTKLLKERLPQPDFFAFAFARKTREHVSTPSGTPKNDMSNAECGENLEQHVCMVKNFSYLNGSIGGFPLSAYYALRSKSIRKDCIGGLNLPLGRKMVFSSDACML
jgi:hypothetical protein